MTAQRRFSSLRRVSSHLWRPQLSICLSLFVSTRWTLLYFTENYNFLLSEFQLYEYVALWLVKFEQPRTQTDFEQSYTFKMFCFQFINFYLPLIYIAVIKVNPGFIVDTKSKFIISRVVSLPILVNSGSTLWQRGRKAIYQWVNRNAKFGLFRNNTLPHSYFS